MKKTITLLIYTLFLLLGSHNISFGQFNARLSLSQTRGLSFGTIAPGTSGGTITITEKGNVTSTGVTLFSIGARHPAQFEIRYIGSNLKVNNVRVSQSIILRGPNGATMQVVNITQPGNVKWNVNPGHSITRFNVGGTLIIGPSAISGTYFGTFDVEVAYN